MISIPLKSSRPTESSRRAVSGVRGLVATPRERGGTGTHVLRDAGQMEPRSMSRRSEPRPPSAEPAPRPPDKSFWGFIMERNMLQGLGSVPGNPRPNSVSSWRHLLGEGCSAWSCGTGGGSWRFRGRPHGHSCPNLINEHTRLGSSASPVHRAATVSEAKSPLPLAPAADYSFPVQQSVLNLAVRRLLEEIMQQCPLSGSLKTNILRDGRKLMRKCGVYRPCHCPCLKD